jgi:senataxin
VYRILFNSTIFSDPAVQTALQGGLYRLDSWPKELVPPGVLLLLFHKDPVIRQFSQSLASKTTVVPVPKEQFVGMYKDVLTSIIDLLSFDMLSNLQSRFSTFAFSTDKRDIWQALQIFLRHVHPDLLKNKQNSIDIRHVVVGHLHDSGAGVLFPVHPRRTLTCLDLEFPDVLGCLLLLLKRLGVEFWSDENDEYPQVVFDAVKDNPAFATLLETVDAGAERSRYLAWFAEYLHTIRKPRVFAEVLAKIIDFLCEEMQHERFGVSRPSTMNTAMLVRFPLSIYVYQLIYSFSAAQWRLAKTSG